MNGKDCRTVRLEIDSSELSQRLSEPVEAHLLACAACSQFRTERTELRELVGSLKCSVCGNVLKRCVDCGHYDAVYQQCALHGFYVYASEAEQPSDDSHSHRCPDYKAKMNVGRAA